MSVQPDRRFLGGETAVLTDTSRTALVVCLGFDGACDIVCNVANEQAVKSLREVIAHIESKPSNVTASTPTAGGDVDGSDTGGDASHKHAVGRVPLSAGDGSRGHDVRRSAPESLPLEGVAGSDLGHPDIDQELVGKRATRKPDDSGLGDDATRPARAAVDDALTAVEAGRVQRTFGGCSS